MDGMDDVDIDALIDEEEEMMAELRQEALQESRKRTMEEPPEDIPRKRRSVVRSVEETDAEVLEADKENEVFPGVSAAPVVVEEEAQVVEEEEALEESVVMTQRPDVDTDYLTVLGEAGRRFYLRVRDEEMTETEAHGAKMGKLTDELFDQVMEKARLERKRWEAADVEETMTTHSHQQTELWVDKYAPRGYTELLSEEFVNRSLLTWLKAWDGSVFGRTTRPHKPSTLPTPYGQAEVRPEMDATGRPVQKVALLCGPPGLGKTTLAYIAARHCGYNVVEVNASDDRSPEVFRQRLEAGANTRYSVSGEQRPVCVILDEVDGAPQPAIDVLVNACKAPTQRQGKKRGVDVPALLRPVICVCNDAYALALRQLRPLAFLVKFPAPQLPKLASRLLSVLQQEKMRADVGALTALAERSERDVRACLNTLQFLRCRGVDEVTLPLLSRLNLGHKDVQKGLFSAWDTVFSLPRHNNSQSSRAAAFDAGISHTASLLSQRTSAVLRACGRSAGDGQRLVDGLHENFLHLRFKDARMRKVDAAFDWLTFVDRLNHTVHSIQDFSLLRYQSYLPVFFHLNFAGPRPERLQWPQAGFQAHQASGRTHSVLSAVSGGMSASTRVPQRDLLLDVLPHLTDILQPALRPVNTQLYSARERLELQRLVNNMLQFGLEWRQERSPEGQYDFVLEPDLALVARFPAVRQTKGLSYSAKQLVSRELAMERMRRSEAARGPVNKALSSPATRRQSAWNIAQQVQQVRSVKQERSRDFFGRTITLQASEPTSDKNGQEEDKKSPLNEKIWFKFKTGYSNAIRRPVRIKDLL